MTIMITLPLNADELASAREWIKSREGKPASQGMFVAVRLLATLDALPAAGMIVDTEQIKDELQWLRTHVPGVDPYRWTPEGEPCYCDTQETVLHPGWHHSLICIRNRDDAGAVAASTSRILAALAPTPSATV
jgi:hypothetical protein